MAPHTLYKPYDRVWVKMEGYDWWPARVVGEEELHASGQIRPDGFDLTVCFYEGTTTPASLEHFRSATANLTFFETSSEKAVTVDADRLAAIRRAEGDAMANPLRYECAETPGSHAPPIPSRKRPPSGDELRPDGATLSDANLSALSARVEAAVRAADAATLRVELCDLDGVAIGLRQLETTRIGVAVGGILGQRELEKLWPLARALLSSWARALPAETMEAIKRHQQYRLGRKGEDAKGMEESMGTPLQTGAPSFEELAQAREGHNHNSNSNNHSSNHNKDRSGAQEVEGRDKARLRFVHRVRKMLDNPTDPPIPNLTSADLDAVAEELCRDIVESEDRKHLQEQLEKPGMVQLRRDLATRALSGAEFLQLPRSALMTEDEKRMEEARITKMIEDQDKVKYANMAISSLFKCPSCGKSRCSFYEQQTRSADEPTTKFLTCLECKHAWTME